MIQDKTLPAVENAEELAASVVTAFLANNTMELTDVPKFIRDVVAAFKGADQVNADEDGKPQQPTPAAIRKSINADYIVCFEDGKQLKMLKRHLMTHYQMTPDQYRERWGLPADYPMVAPAYAEKRRELAKTIGLGRKPGEKPGQKRNPAQGRRPK